MDRRAPRAPAGRAGSVHLASFLTPSDHGGGVIDASNDAGGGKTEPSSSSSRAGRVRTPRESRRGTSSSPPTGFGALVTFATPAEATASASLARPREGAASSIASAASTRSATSSPKSPTWANALFALRDVAFCRLRSVLERGTRVKRSSSIFARASMRASSRLANALEVPPSSPPSSSGASPSSCASSCHEEEARDAVRRKERARGKGSDVSGELSRGRRKAGDDEAVFPSRGRTVDKMSIS